MNSQCDLGKLGAHTQQSGYPHPKDCSGTADGNCAGYTGNVTGAYRGRQCGADCLERRNGALAGVTFVEKLAKRGLDGIAETAKLDELGPHAEEDACADDTHDGGNAPYESIDRIVYGFYNSVNVFHSVVFLSNINNLFILSEKDKKWKINLQKNGSFKF